MTWRDRLLIVEAATLLTLVWIGVHVLPFRIWWRLLERDRPRDRDPAHRIDRVGWAVTAVARRLPGSMTCLVQAIAAHVMLRRRGHAPTLHLGVCAPGGASLDAHAWLECEGRVLVGELDNLANYAVLQASVRR